MIELQLSSQPLEQIDADILVLLTHNTRKQGALRELDGLLEGQLFAQIEREEFKAKEGQSLSLSTWDRIAAPQLLLLGLGDDEATPHLWRQAAADAIRAVSGKKLNTLALAVNGRPDDLSHAIEGMALGATLASYRFDTYKSKDKDKSDGALKQVALVLPGRTSATAKKKSQRALEQALSLSQSICAARDLVNEPPNTLTPTEFAERASAMAEEVGLACEIWGPDELRELGMNLFLAVSTGSTQEPRMIRLTYKPKKSRKKKDARVLALVGKGVTFDSGGLSLKPTNFMLNMHADMAGAAAVFGAMRAIALTQPDCEVQGYIGATENMTGAAAFRINDIVRGYNGKTVEIKNTDAEGRLVLADVIAYAAEQGATELIDLATLTGACVVALGPWTAGLMSNDDDMAQHLLQAARDAGEDLWQLPLTEELRSQLKSQHADLSNVGGRYGGAITAGLFLREFVPDKLPWAHLDIAGPSIADKNLHHISKGGTGFAVATLLQYATAPD